MKIWFVKRVIFCRTVLTTKASKNFVFTKSKFRLSSSIDGEKTPKNPTQKDNQNEVVETNFVPTHPLGSQNYLLKSRKSQHFTRRMLTDESINLVQNLLILSPLLNKLLLRMAECESLNDSSIAIMKKFQLESHGHAHLADSQIQCSDALISCWNIWFSGSILLEFLLELL